MSNPGNSAARNTMSEFERQCYDWGWSDAEARIIKLLEDEIWHRMVIQATNPPKRAHSYDCIGCKQIALINGEQNPHVRAETMALTTLNTANIGNSARPCGCKGETND